MAFSVHRRVWQNVVRFHRRKALEYFIDGLLMLCAVHSNAADAVENEFVRLNDFFA